MNDITLTFGKHNGKKLSECPYGYIEWLAKQVTICGKEAIPQAARDLIKEMPVTLYPCKTIEDAEKLSWMASKGNERAAATLLAERAARGDKDGYVTFYGDDDDEMLFKISDDGTGYVTSRWEIEEEAERNREEAITEAEKEAHPDLEWFAQSGQHIKIWIDENYDNDMQVYIVDIDGVKNERIIDDVPAKKRTWAKQNGVVAVLGGVGLTAERKAILEAKAKGETTYAKS